MAMAMEEWLATGKEQPRSNRPKMGGNGSVRNQETKDGNGK